MMGNRTQGRKTMTGHLHRELDILKKKLLALAAVVEETVQQAVLALENCDDEQARRVVAADDRINALEVDLEEECLKALALYQPVAGDLRYIVAILKMNNDMERIGDLSRGIAERVLSLTECNRVPAPYDLRAMADEARQMLKYALDALVNRDLDLATRVVTLDDQIDQRHADNFEAVKKAIQEDPGAIHAHMSYLTVSRHLERIADLATNIAEDVVYMVQGKIVRHQLGDETKLKL